MRKFKLDMKKIFDKLVVVTVAYVKRNVFNGEFGKDTSYGKPLTELTVRIKRAKGSSRPDIALYDEGVLHGGIKGFSKPRYALITSAGREEEQKYIFAERNMFSTKQPGEKGDTLNDTVVVRASAMIFQQASDQIKTAVDNANASMR